MDDKTILLLMMFVCFVIMAVPMPLNHTGGLTAVRRLPAGFVLNGRDMVGEASLFPSSMAANRSKRDVEALLSFRQGIISDPHGALSNWAAENAYNVCRWNGISCRPDTKRVVSIILSRCGLQGSLSPSIDRLSLLRTLHLSWNALSGRIPPEFGQLKALEILDRRVNALQGSIPSELCNCPRLQLIDFSLNELSGSIPADFGRLVHLRYLILVRSALNGSIPTSLANCTSLLELDVGSNNLSGPIPSEFGHLVSGFQLDVGINNLGGPIPVEFGLLV